ncbi:hypothetical protein BJ508DRAFT_419412 [Ascobolus immersus RN42]|uniref:DUF1772-domain-containing protein n=1 Tax=Ascobolus immersus RN42 TaxID=1160509 RepID=A0A3N4HEG1_ASCIM|nr:hypothetical protein BJ508DRAFT_419412 [Ascobolus immersus RN42]
MANGPGVVSSTPHFLPPAIRLAKIFGLMGTGILTGTYLTHSLHTVPALAELNAAPTAIKRAFTQIHHSSHRILLAVILGTSSSFSLVAYHLYYAPLGNLADYSPSFMHIAGTWAYFASAATLVAGLIPYSKTIMASVNHKVIESADTADITRDIGVTGLGGLEVQKKELSDDLISWSKRNWWRGAISLVAGFSAGFMAGGDVAY